MYLAVDDIKPRIHYRSDDFSLTSSEFDDLLETIETETRELINSHMGDESFSKETGRIDKFSAKDSAAIPLTYPVDSITKVEYKRKISGSWRELDSDRYTSTEHRLKLRRYPEIFYERRQCRSMNRLNYDSSRLAWSDFAVEIKVTYDRGYDSVPANVKNIQIDMINKTLRKLKNEQNISAMNPEQMEAVTQSSRIMTEDIMKRLDDITSMKNFVRSV